MVHKKSQKKKEEWMARKYAYEHSVSKHRNNQLDEMRERIFTGSPDKLREAVLSEIQGERTGEIPEYPTGLVISDSRGEGFFDVHLP